VQALLLVGLYQLFYTRVPAHAAIGETVGCADKLKKPWAKGLLNAVLRNAQREGETIFAELERDPVVRTAHPRWLQKALKAFWPEQWEAICAANNAHPPMILRVNRRITAAMPISACSATLALRHAVPAARRHRPRSRHRRAQLAGLPQAGSACRTKPRNWPPICSIWRRANGCWTPASTRRQNLPHPRSRTGLAGVVAVDLEAKRLVRVKENLIAWAERRTDRR
jgi:16S rRNA (cytosine967-C5)-methyltransferase